MDENVVNLYGRCSEKLMFSVFVCRQVCMWSRLTHRLWNKTWHTSTVFRCSFRQHELRHAAESPPLSPAQGERIRIIPLLIWGAPLRALWMNIHQECATSLAGGGGGWVSSGSLSFKEQSHQSSVLNRAGWRGALGLQPRGILTKTSFQSDLRDLEQPAETGFNTPPRSD